MASTDTYWAAEQSQPELVRRCMAKYSAQLARMQTTGRLSRAYSLMSTYYGWGVDGLRDAAKLRDAGEQGEVTELHLNGVAPVVQNVLSLVCSQRPSVKPRAVNADVDSAAQTRLALQLHTCEDERTSSAELEVEVMRGAFIASQWWLMQGWAAHEGAEYAYDQSTDTVLYEGEVELFDVPPWWVAFDTVARRPEQRRWVLFARQENRWELLQRVKDPDLQAKLRAHKGGQPTHLTSEASTAAWGQVQALDRLREDIIDEEDGVLVWELRHRPTQALRQGRLVRFVDANIVLWDSMAADVGGQKRPVRYPYDESELHAYDAVPERAVGSSAGHSGLFNALGPQQFLDIATASIATTVNLLGMPHLWSPDGDGVRQKRLSSGPSLLVTKTKPELVDLPALKPEVVQAAEWALSMQRQVAALNDVVMGQPPSGMPASAQALQRAQAVQYHEVAQKGYVRLVQRNANGRLRLLKRFARTERVAELVGASGEWESKKWKAEDIAGIARFDVEPVNPASTSFEGRQAILDMMAPGEVDVMGRIDFLQTGSLPKALQSNTARSDVVDRNVELLERGIGLPPIAGANPDGSPMFQAGGEFVRLYKSDPHHLALPRYIAVANSAASRTDKRAAAAISAAMETFRLWTSMTPDECIAYGIPMLPSHQMAMAPPPPSPGGPPPPGAPSGGPAPVEPPGDEGVPLPAPPPSPVTGEGQSSDALDLPNG